MGFEYFELRIRGSGLCLKSLVFPSAGQAEVLHHVQCAAQLSLQYRNKHLQSKQGAVGLPEGHAAGIQDEWHYVEMLGIKLVI